MRKFLLVLGIITCMLGLTACGAEKEVDKLPVTEEEVISYTDSVITDINMVVTGGTKDSYRSDAIISAALDSWENALADMGDYQTVKDHEVTIGSKDVIASVTVAGSKRDAVVEFVFEDVDGGLMMASVSTNIVYTLGEQMGRAGLNTLLGMGTVFTVLILISLIISCFKFIGKPQSSGGNNEVKQPVKAEPAVQTMEQEVEEDLTDDLELAAVIAAAIAASEGAVSADGFVVRSIRKSNKWQRA